ncbi:hypothetical protein ACG7TL_003448 [Trametes sanguinea]
MPCNWSTTASLLLRSFQLRTSSHVRSRSTGRFSQLTLPTGFCTIPRNTLLSRLRGFRGLATVTAAAAPQPGSPHLSNEPSTAAIQSKSANLSPAQVSRAAAQAVRLCIEDREFGDALYVVNSACHSVLQGPLQSSDQPKSQLEPIQFGQPVSPRLSAHAFLHGLIRGGYHKKASTYAALMIRAGIPIRTKTMESIISTMYNDMLQFGPFAKVTHPKSRYDSPSILQLRSSIVSNECTRAALDLVREARTFGQRRTQRMYRTLIETLLLQGEILVASLLFVLLVKDFEVRNAWAAAQAQSATTENHITHEVLRVSPPSPAALRHMPYPDPSLMTPILDAIDSASRDPPNIGPEIAQSLALFAMLLDTGQIGHGRVAGLISSLYQFPRIDTCVWIWRDGKPLRVLAYQYFHEVLKRLIDSLSKDNPSPLAGLRLSQRSYNSLLTYALRHRLSPEMASAVLHHMCEVRQPPCEPNVVTFNTLLRSGTLLRRMDISDTALAAFRAASKDRKTQALFDELDRIRSESGVVSRAPTGQQALIPQGPIAPEDDAPGFAGTLRRLFNESFVVPDKVSNPYPAMASDRHTFTSMVMHLTSTGHPDAVASTLFRIVPELALVDHPASGTASPAAIPQLDAHKAMKRAVLYGPYFYSCLINALAKAGEVGLAERVFILGQKAERASRQRRFSPCPPWKLTKHSYTALMRAYANVVRGRVPRHKRRESYLGTALLDKSKKKRSKKQTTYTIESGYARYVQMRDQQSARTRRLTKPQQARRNAVLLYRSLVSGGKTLFENLMGMTTEDLRRLRPRPRADQTYEVKPDERFFNAALKLFAPAPRRILTRHRTPSYYRRHWRRATRARGRSERTASKVSPMFRRVLRAIARRGFDVPLAYRHVLGEDDGFRVREPRKANVRSPFAFPRPASRANKPFEIPVAKTRGLPIRRHTMKRLLMGREQVAQVETSV